MNKETSNHINVTLSIDEIQLLLLGLDNLLFNILDKKTRQKTILRLIKSKNELGLTYNLTQAEKTPESFADASLGLLLDKLNDAWADYRHSLLSAHIGEPMKCLSLGFDQEAIENYIESNPKAVLNALTSQSEMQP